MVNTCCRCLDLYSGTLVIGAIYIVVYILSLVAAIVLLAVTPEELLLPLYRSGVDLATVNTLIWWLRVLLWVMFSVSLLMLAVSALLIRGVQTGNVCMVLFWLVIQGIVLSLTSIGYVYQVVTTISGGIAAAMVPLLATVWAGLQWYWYIVVASFYRALKAGDEDVMPPLSAERRSSQVVPLQPRVITVSDRRF